MITKTHQGKTVQLTDLQFRPAPGRGGRLLLKAEHYDQRRTDYHCYVEADQLLNTAKQSLRTLSDISGVQYRAVIIVDNKSYFI